MSTTTKAAHTPGPWEVDADRFWVRSTVEESIVATIEKDLHFRGEQQANADLIAAAPEILESLEAFVALANFDADTIPKTSEEWDAMVAKAEAAIKKARGGQ